MRFGCLRVAERHIRPLGRTRSDKRLWLPYLQQCSYGWPTPSSGLLFVSPPPSEGQGACPVKQPPNTVPKRCSSDRDDLLRVRSSGQRQGRRGALYHDASRFKASMLAPRDSIITEGEMRSLPTVSIARQSTEPTVAVNQT